MPTVTVTFIDGTHRPYHPQVARFGGVDLQLCGDPDHWPVLDVHRSAFTAVDVDGQTWAVGRVQARAGMTTYELARPTADQRLCL